MDDGLEGGWSGILRDTECGVETNNCHVKYEANVSELACDELNKIDC